MYFWGMKVLDWAGGDESLHTLGLSNPFHMVSSLKPSLSFHGFGMMTSLGMQKPSALRWEHAWCAARMFSTEKVLIEGE